MAVPYAPCPALLPAPAAAAAKARGKSAATTGFGNERLSVRSCFIASPLRDTHSGLSPRHQVSPSRSRAVRGGSWRSRRFLTTHSQASDSSSGAPPVAEANEISGELIEASSSDSVTTAAAASAAAVAGSYAASVNGTAAAGTARAGGGAGAGASATAAAAAADMVATSEKQLSAGLAAVYGNQKRWTWKDVGDINYSVLREEGGRGGGAGMADTDGRSGGGSSSSNVGSTTAVVLVHGFGASVGHWRKLMPQLAQDGYSVYALDLLGLGASDKPQGFPYSIEAWAELVDDFVRSVVDEHNVVLVGNSIGSLVALAAAAGAQSEAGLHERVRGVVLLNIAGGLNNKAIVDDWRIKLALPIFWFIDFLLSIPPVAAAIFNSVRTRDNVRAALTSVYRNKDSVDDELVDLIMRPADDAGALSVFVAIITGPPGPRPEVLIPRLGDDCGVLLLWGDSDPFTPADGPVGRYFQQLPGKRPNTSFVSLPDVGHCPQDDRPELVHEALLPWLKQLQQGVA